MAELQAFQFSMSEPAGILILHGAVIWEKMGVRYKMAVGLDKGQGWQTQAWKKADTWHSISQAEVLAGT